MKRLRVLWTRYKCILPVDRSCTLWIGEWTWTLWVRDFRMEFTITQLSWLWTSDGSGVSHLRRIRTTRRSTRWLWRWVSISRNYSENCRRDKKQFILTSSSQGCPISALSCWWWNNKAASRSNLLYFLRTHSEATMEIFLRFIISSLFRKQLAAPCLWPRRRKRATLTSLSLNETRRSSKRTFKD